MKIISLTVTYIPSLEKWQLHYTQEDGTASYVAFRDPLEVDCMLDLIRRKIESK